MKKIIEGRMYNTDTATLVGEYSNPGGWRDFQHYEEALYQKKTGEFFIYGKGGPMTQYARSVDQSSWSGGEKIIPLTYTEAKQWVEDHMDADDYERLFGAIVEDDTKQMLTLYMTRGLVDRLRREAQESGVGLSALIESKL